MKVNAHMAQSVSGAQAPVFALVFQGIPVASKTKAGAALKKKKQIGRATVVAGGEPIKISFVSQGSEIGDASRGVSGSLPRSRIKSDRATTLSEVTNLNRDKFRMK
jgi:hypothetical protein